MPLISPYIREKFSGLGAFSKMPRLAYRSSLGADSGSDDESGSSESEILPRQPTKEKVASSSPEAEDDVVRATPGRSRSKEAEKTIKKAKISHNSEDEEDRQSGSAKDKAEDSDSDSDSDGPEEYIVERILKHGLSSEGKNVIIYETKWKGYSVKEATWEPRDSFGEDNDVLEKYWKKIGGEPFYNPKTDSIEVPGSLRAKQPRPIKRKQPVSPPSSTSAKATPASSKTSPEPENEESASPPPSAAKTKPVGKGKRGRPKGSVSKGVAVKRTEQTPTSGGPKKKLKRSENEKPSKSKATDVTFNGNDSESEEEKAYSHMPGGNWNEKIKSIQTIQQKGDVLIIHVSWEDGKTGKYTSDVIYNRAPQKMLKFYEDHLQFTGSSQS